MQVRQNGPTTHQPPAQGENRPGIEPVAHPNRVALDAEPARLAFTQGPGWAEQDIAMPKLAQPSHEEKHLQFAAGEASLRVDVGNAQALTFRHSLATTHAPVFTTNDLVCRGRDTMGFDRGRQSWKVRDPARR